MKPESDIEQCIPVVQFLILFEVVLQQQQQQQQLYLHSLETDEKITVKKKQSVK